MDALNKLKVTELKKMLKEKNLNTDGNKATLVNRLLTAGSKNQSGSEATQETLDTDEDLILGNEENSDEAETKKSKIMPPAKTRTAVVESPAVPEEAQAGETKVSSATQKPTAVNGKMEERIKRFGVVSEDVRKKSRAERFEMTSSASSSIVSGNGVSKPLTTSPSVQKPTEEVLKKRAERFGTETSQEPLTKSGQSDILKKRAARFGTNNSATDSSNKDGEKDIFLKRKARFGGTSLSDGNNTEAKKQKRAKRFGLMSS